MILKGYGSFGGLLLPTLPVGFQLFYHPTKPLFGVTQEISLEIVNYCLNLFSDDAAVFSFYKVRVPRFKTAIWHKPFKFLGGLNRLYGISSAVVTFCHSVTTLLDVRYVSVTNYVLKSFL